jgi:TonB family protein
MPDWMKAFSVTGLLCLPFAYGVCQNDRTASSLAHYRRGEAFLEQDNLQSAANEFREALNGDQDAPWTAVWSHIKLARIFDAGGQHERALGEYRQAQRTGDNTDGAQDDVNQYLAHSRAIYVLPPPPFVAMSGEPIQKIEPEYTDEARLAELEGTVMLRGIIHPEGFVRNLEVAESIGLGLEEKAIEAAAQWQFPPRADQSAFLIPVTFRLPSKQSRWHLIGVHFSAPAGATRPVFMRALYPIGAGIGPDAMEEGRVLVAIGRLATAKLSFNVDEHGVPVNFQTVNSSEPVWGSEATAVVGQWRFTPGVQNGIAIPVPCTVELVWGEKKLSPSLERQLHDVLAAR